MNLHALPTVVLATYAVYSLIVVVAFGFMLRIEYTTLRARNKTLAWWVVRLAAIPMLALCAALVIMPARATGGMEGLAVFYLLLLTLAPAAWFSLHWLLGKIARPSLSGGESFALGLTIPTFAIAAALLGQLVQSLAFSLDHLLHAPPSAVKLVEGQPSAAVHTRQHTLRFSTTGGDFFVSRWHSPLPITIERVDWVQGKREIHGVDRLRAMNVCRDGNDLVMLEAADRAPGYFRVHWRSADSPLYRSDLTTRDASAQAQPLTPAWTARGVTLPETFPRYSLVIGRLQANGQINYTRDESGASSANDPDLFKCLPMALQSSTAPAGVYFTISRQDGDILTTEIKRPKADPAISIPAAQSDFPPPVRGD